MMDTIDKLLAIEEIKQCKARYWRAVDTKDFELLRTALAEDIVFDLSESTWDPHKGQHPIIPRKQEPSRSCEEIINNCRKVMGDNVQSAHMGHIPEITLTSETTAEAIFPFEDRVLTHDYASFNGYGYYTDTFEKIEGEWKVKTSKIHRFRVIWDYKEV